jgi:hypoxanthine-guanine phosphoribosyltransferase
MSRKFESSPTREEIPILRGQIFTEQQVWNAICYTALAESMDYHRDQNVVIIQVNEGARFFANGIQNARSFINPRLKPPVYPIKIQRTNTDSSFRKPAIVEGLPEGLDLTGVKVSVHEDIVDEGRTLAEAVVPHIEAKGAEIDNIVIRSLLARNVKRDEYIEGLVKAALVFDGDGFVFGSGIDDHRLTQYERYEHDAGRGEKGIWENDPVTG